MNNENNVLLQQLVGKTIVETKGAKQDSEFVIKTECGLVFEFYHEQDCCEGFWLEEIIGDLDDLLAGPVIMAEEVSNADDPIDTQAQYYDSHTWTFYRIATQKGLVVLRFLGESNGYYSESATVRSWKEAKVNPSDFMGIPRYIQ